MPRSLQTINSTFTSFHRQARDGGSFVDWVTFTMPPGGVFKQGKRGPPGCLGYIGGCFIGDSTTQVHGDSNKI